MFFEAVTRRLSTVARAQQAAQRSVLSSLAAAALLPLHVVGTLLVSAVKLAWALLLAATFLLPAALRPPLALCVCCVLAYAAYLAQLSAGRAVAVAAALVAFIFLPMLVRAASRRLLTKSMCGRSRSRPGVLPCNSLHMAHAWSRICLRVRVITLPLCVQHMWSSCPDGIRDGWRDPATWPV